MSISLTLDTICALSTGKAQPRNTCCPRANPTDRRGKLTSALKEPAERKGTTHLLYVAWSWAWVHSAYVIRLHLLLGEDEDVYPISNEGSGF